MNTILSLAIILILMFNLNETLKTLDCKNLFQTTFPNSSISDRAYMLGYCLGTNIQKGIDNTTIA
jgi:hypothetical protein